MHQNSPSILIAGIGSPLLRDGGAGHHTVTLAQKRLHNRERIVFRRFGAGGMELLDGMDGFDRAILVDCCSTGGCPGDFIEATVDESCSKTMELRFAESHGIDLAEVLALGKTMGCRLPRPVVVFDICGEDLFSFGTEPTPRVAEALERVVDRIEENVVHWLNTVSGLSASIRR